MECCAKVSKLERNLKERAITLDFFFKNLRKSLLDIHIRNVMPKFESSRLNDVAVIAKTHIHTYTHTMYGAFRFFFYSIDSRPNTFR